LSFCFSGRLPRLIATCKLKLIQRACEFLALANCSDDQTLRLIEETLESVLRKYSPTGAASDRLGREPAKETPGSF